MPTWGSPADEAHTPRLITGPTPPPDDGRLTGTLLAALQTHHELEIVESRDILGEGGYTMTAPDGTRIATLARRTTGANLVFGEMSTSRYLIHDGAGALVSEMVRAGSFSGTGDSELFDRQGRPLGAIARENAYFGAPRLRLAGIDGQHLRMAGGSWNDSNRYQVVDGADENLLVATVHRRNNGMFSSTQKFWIAFAATTVPPLDRFLTMVATVCMDEIRDKNS